MHRVPPRPSRGLRIHRIRSLLDACRLSPNFVPSAHRLAERIGRPAAAKDDPSNEPRGIRIPCFVVMVEKPRIHHSIPPALPYLEQGRKGEAHATYLSKFSYTPETWSRLIDNPEDRRNAAREYIESVGGTLHGFWYGFGSYDGYNLWEAPDNVSMAAVALAISGGRPQLAGDDRFANHRRNDGGTAHGWHVPLPRAGY